MNLITNDLDQRILVLPRKFKTEYKAIFNRLYDLDNFDSIKYWDLWWYLKVEMRYNIFDED